MKRRMPQLEIKTYLTQTTQLILIFIAYGFIMKKNILPSVLENLYIRKTTNEDKKTNGKITVKSSGKKYIYKI